MTGKWDMAKPGDQYWIVMGDSPPHLVESGVIGPDGERIPDPVPYWRKPPRPWDKWLWNLGDWLYRWGRKAQGK